MCVCVCVYMSRQVVNKGRRETGKIIFIKIFIKVLNSYFTPYFRKIK